MSSKDNDEEHVMHSKSSYIEILMNGKAEEVTGELLQSLLSRYHIWLFHWFYYKFLEINFKWYGSYIDSPDWIKNRKAVIKPINEKEN